MLVRKSMINARTSANDCNAVLSLLHLLDVWAHLVQVRLPRERLRHRGPSSAETGSRNQVVVVQSLRLGGSMWYILGNLGVHVHSAD